MNIFNKLEQDIVAIIEALSAKGLVPAGIDTSRIVVELPRDETHGDLATNAAMVLAKPCGMKPRDLAELITAELLTLSDVAAAEIAGPGFINIQLQAGRWGEEITHILAEGTNYGRSQIGAGTHINVEFVSANPTGPLHAAHARGAIFGDALAQLLAFSGYDVTREYYINDAGAQVDVLARSAYLRYREALGEAIGEIPVGLYPGDYLCEVGQYLADTHGERLRDQDEAEWLPLVRSTAIDMMMAGIKADLATLGVKMDVFSSEKSLVESGIVAETIEHLRADGLVFRGVLEPPKGQKDEDWEPREQLLFKATAFGDDVDRPLQKSDGSWTYFAADMAYHMDKWKRTDGKMAGEMINVWGADHGGYVKRMKAATQALSGAKDKLDVKLCQLVSLLDNGQPVKMSKRAGTFVTLSDVMEAVGPDVMRFIMLTRRNDQSLEFDYAKVTEKSRENPVFYVQYAHARACSVLRQPDLPAPQEQIDLGVLNDVHELRLIRHLASWPKLIEAAAQAHEPHRIAFYLMDLAAAFHGLWNAGRDNPALKFVQPDAQMLTLARLELVKATALVIRSGLSLLSIDAVEEM